MFGFHHCCVLSGECSTGTTTGGWLTHLSMCWVLCVGTLSVSNTCSSEDSFQPQVQGLTALFPAMARPDFPGCFELLLKITFYYHTLQRILVLILGVGHTALLGPEIKDFSVRFGVRARGFANKAAWLLAQSGPSAELHAKLPCFSCSISFFFSQQIHIKHLLPERHYHKSCERYKKKKIVNLSH